MSEPGKERYYSCVVAGVLIILCAGPIALGVDATSLPPDQRVLTSAQQQLKERVSFTCRDLPIDTVLMQLADQADVDIIKSPGVKGNVTVKITDVPLDEALNNILAAHGWTYVASENIIRVMKLADVDTAKEKLATSIYRITYANVEDVAKALKDYISSKGNIAFNKGTNHIIITDSDRKIKSIDRFIAQIDRQTPQVMVEARIYDITTTEGFEIGFEWAASRNTPLTTVADKNKFSRTDTANPDYSETVDITEDFFYLIDDFGRVAPAVWRDIDGDPIYPPGHALEGQEVPAGDEPFQVLEDNPAAPWIPEEMRVTPWDDRLELDPEGTEFGESKLGKRIPPSGWGTEETREITETDMPILKRKPFIGGSFTQDGGGSLRFGLLNNMIDLDIALSLLSSQVEAKLLANPRVLVLDNETANIKIVTEIPYSESLQTATASGLVIARVRFKDVGVQLLVTPHVAREGMIRLKLKPEFGVQAEPQEIKTGLALEAPAVNTRTLETIALVKDGQTVVMGGLRKMETSKDIKKVPLLGDLPLLGGLFRYETENEKTNELVVFITPKIVSTNVLTELEESQLKATEIRSPGLSKSNKKKRTGAESDQTDVVAVESEDSANSG